MSQRLCSPCGVHLNAIYNIFRYLQKNKSKNPGSIPFDPDFVHTDEKLFEGSTRESEYWKDFYPDSAEAHPRKKSEPLGEPVTIWVYLDEIIQVTWQIGGPTQGYLSMSTTHL